MSAAVDTLQIAKDLKAASFSDAQAEALAHLMRQRQEADLAQLMTKADGALLRAEIERRIDRLEQRIDQVEQNLTIKLGGMLVVAIGVVAALVKLL